MKRVWVDNEVFNWFCYFEALGSTDKERGRRAYEIWEHARNLIDSNDSLLHLSDGITNLKRALNQRTQYIEEIYKFKSIKLSNKPKGTYEILELFGVVKPFLIKRLLDIRNDIEHRDISPPSIDKCKELADVVWYFLKSTDSIITWIKDYLIFEEEVEGETFRFEIEYLKTKDTFVIYGKIPSRFLHENHTDDTFEVILGHVQDSEILPSALLGDENYCYRDDEIFGEAKSSDLMKIKVITKSLNEFS